MSGIIFILGMAGSGKTTLANGLKDYYGLPVLIGGDVARELAKHDPETAAALHVGQMAPKEKMNIAMKLAMAKWATKYELFIVDGYPRYLAQYQDLLNINVHPENFHFVLVGCNDGVAIERLNSRRREDDTDESIANRIANFWKETYPMWDIFRERHKHFHVPIGTPLDALHATAQFLTEHGLATWPPKPKQDEYNESNTSTNEQSISAPASSET